MVKGLDRFKESFLGERDQYVLLTRCEGVPDHRLARSLSARN